MSNMSASPRRAGSGNGSKRSKINLKTRWDAPLSGTENTSLVTVLLTACSFLSRWRSFRRKIRESAGQRFGALVIVVSSRGLVKPPTVRNQASPLSCVEVRDFSPKQVVGHWTRSVATRKLSIAISLAPLQLSPLRNINISSLVEGKTSSSTLTFRHSPLLRIVLRPPAVLVALPTLIDDTVASAIKLLDVLAVKPAKEVYVSSANSSMASLAIDVPCGLGHWFVMTPFQTFNAIVATSDNIATLVDPLSIGREKDVASAAKEPASPARSIQLKSMISTPNKSKNKEGSPPCQPRHASPSLRKPDTTPSAPSSPKISSKWALPCKPRSLAELESTSSSWALPGQTLSEPFLGEKNASRFSTPALGMARQVPPSPGRSIKIAINLKAGGNGDGDEDQNESDYGNDKTTNIRSVSTATTVRDSPISAAVRSTKVTITPTRSVLKSSENYEKRDRAVGSCVRVHWRDILVEEDAQVAKERQQRAARWLRPKRQGPSTATPVSGRAIKISGVDDKVEKGSGAG